MIVWTKILVAYSIKTRFIYIIIKKKHISLNKYNILQISKYKKTSVMFVCVMSTISIQELRVGSSRRRLLE